MKNPDRSPVRTLGSVLIAILIAAGLALALFRPTAEVELSQATPDFDRASADAPVVTSLTAEGGFSIFGIRLSSPTHYVQVGFEAPAACSDAASTHWPTGDPACGPSGPIAGEISGRGISIDGDALVVVRFDVTADCFESLSIGDVWNPTVSCRAGV